MRRVVVSVGLVAVLLAGCSTQGSVEECGAVADDGIELIQQLIDEVDAMSQAEFDSGTGMDFMADIETKADALDEDAAARRCTETQMVTLLEERAAQLTAETARGQIVLDTVLADGFFANE